MKVICAVCHILLREIETDTVGTSHGYCRLHELETYDAEGLITPDELRELRTIQWNISQSR